MISPHPPRFPPRSQPALVAHHQAGHAVTAFAQDLPISLIVFRVGGGGVTASGACPCLPEGLKISGVSPGMRDYWESLIAVFLAGVEAENRYRGQQHLGRVGLPQDDQTTVDAIAAALYLPEDRAVALRRLQGRARKVLASPGHWLAVQRLAHLLHQRLPRWWLEQGLEAEVSLTGDEVRREFDLVCGLAGRM
jgi:hypothetical protein